MTATCTGTDWQTFDTAPKDGTHILIVDGYGAMLVGWWGEDCVLSKKKAWVYGDSWGKWGDYSEVYDPTHWMPLPKKPI